MKIRNGFVSNSSSSSFVMVGIKVDLEEEYDKLIDYKIEAKGLSIKTTDDFAIVGLNILKWEYEEGIESLLTIDVMRNQVTTLLDSAGLDSSNVKIFGGTTM